MNHERPAPEDIPGTEGIEVLQRQDQDQDQDQDPRERNGTDADADENQLGVTEEEVNDLEDDAKGG